ncbi:unnamed protein product [Symbiodinium sp. CCMP2592]|nr:unnamed protein product [Symbiodinium sp. CCMP2592]
MSPSPEKSKPTAGDPKQRQKSPSPEKSKPTAGDPKQRQKSASPEKSKPTAGDPKQRQKSASPEKSRAAAGDRKQRQKSASPEKSRAASGDRKQRQKSPSPEKSRSAAGDRNEKSRSPVRSRVPVKQEDMSDTVAACMDAFLGEVKLSSVKKRMARMFAPRADGTFLVPKELVEQYKDLKQRAELEKKFLKAGLDKDLFVKRSVKRIKRRESESELWVSGQFVSDSDMVELGLSEKRRKAVHAECAKMRGWIRRDRYEPDVKLYWLEKSVEGKVLKRKREIYEECDSDADYEASDEENDMDVFSMSWGGLGEGGNDANVAGADREADVRKRMKAISFPEMDADGLPSTYIVKVVACLAKWTTRTDGVVDSLDQYKKSEKTERKLGLSLAGRQQDELKKIFDTGKKQLPVVADLEKTNFAQGAIVFDLASSKLASSILSHSELCIRSISSKHPALYKIGVTRNPVCRWLHTGYGYKLDRHVHWERMTVLHVHCNADVICLLEAALIRIFFNAPGCRNIRLGGEGIDEQSSGPFFCYVVQRVLVQPCVEALSFTTGVAPMLQYLKTQKKKDEDSASKRAPATSVTAHQRAMVLQKGVEATREELGGVLGTSEQNSARHVEKIVVKFGLRPRIPISYHTLIVDSENYTVPYLAPKDMLSYLLSYNADLVLGGYAASDPAANRGLALFWGRYRDMHPSHAVFGAPAERLRWTIPISLHGDGGRTQKKRLGGTFGKLQPLEVISLEPTLGIGRVEPKPCTCAEPVLQIGQQCNGKFHSYLTRFLVVAYPKKQWPEELLSDIFKLLSNQLRELFENGLLVNGRRFYFGILGMKADFEFQCACLRDAGLNRSYEHVGRAKDIAVCIECEAGFPEIPFEDANRNAAWTKTIGKSAPWERLPSFAQMPFDNWHSFPSRAPQFFRRDPFHVFRLGFLAFPA